jgi:hypothetical protein
MLFDGCFDDIFPLLTTTINTTNIGSYRLESHFLSFWDQNQHKIYAHIPVITIVGTATRRNDFLPVSRVLDVLHSLLHTVGMHGLG